MFETELFRNGPKGKIGPWRCVDHIEKKYMPDEVTIAVNKLMSAKLYSGIDIKKTVENPEGIIFLKERKNEN